MTLAPASSQPPSAQTDRVLNATVIVTALGYLVDVYDILIFNVTRVPSLTELGLSGDALTQAGLFILNMQLAGLVLGGLLFGVLGDKIGRKACLLGSILLYSLATLACAAVQSVDHYAWLRFVAGIGLAGEIGIGVALITETMTKERRTLGVTFFTFVGISGAVLASLAAFYLPWRMCYLIGGIAGLLLLIGRSRVLESGLFEARKHDSVRRGSLIHLFSQSKLRLRYLFCIMLGMPLFFTMGIIWTLSPELGRAFGIAEPLSAPVAVGLGYIGVMVGDLVAGLLSQHFRQRRGIVALYLWGLLLTLAGLFTCAGMSATTFYVFAALAGFWVGYWINLVMIAAEQFGTNLRATASTSIPNFARATLLPMNVMLGALVPSLGFLSSVVVVGAASLVMAAYALYRLRETYDKDLDYVD